MTRVCRVSVALVLVAAVLAAAGPVGAQSDATSGGLSDASLSGLAVSGFSGESRPQPVLGLVPAFDSGVLGYGASATFVPRVRVRATAAGAGASVSVDGESVASGELSQVLFLGNGTNASKRVVVQVTAGDGVTVRSYSVVVVNNPVAQLSDLELSGAQIRPSVFATSQKEYGAWVAHGVGSVRVTATADYASVALAVNGKSVVSGQASDAVPLDVGSNLITVTATAPDGFTKSSYTVTVRRASLAQSADASLSGISVWKATSKQPGSANDVAYSGGAFALSPAVSGSVREHWLEVPEDAGRYVYLAVAADTTAPGAKQILVSGTKSIEEARDPKRDVVSGEASGPWYAPVGHSVITVEVTSLDGTASESYRLIVKSGTVDDPKGVSAAAGDGSLRVSWEQSDSPAAPDYYTLRWRKAGETQWLNPQPLAAVGVTRSLAAGAPVVTAEDGNGVVPAASLGHTIAGLDNGTAYEIQVRALRGTVQAHRPLRWLASGWQSLTATPGKPRTVLSITPDHPTRAYGAADDLTYTVGGLAQGDAASDVVTGELSRTAGNDAGSYPISMGTVAVASSYADTYELPAAPAVAAYVIEPRPIPAISGVLVETRDQDGTAGASFDTTNAAGVDVLPAELADFRAGGLVVAGSFPTAAAGAHNVAATYSLADHGAFKAANYELLQTTATLQGRIDAAAEAQPACTPAAGGDYDRDDDGLIEICDLEQLNAIRFDANGDAVPDRGTAYEYLRAFPQIISGGPGCPIGCDGYELVVDLDFDTNGNGRADSGDQFWNDGLGWEPMPILGRAYTGAFEGNGHTISNLHMNKPNTMSKVGLFSEAGGGAKIRNITLKSVGIYGARHDIGGLVGINRGRISNSHVSGELRADPNVSCRVGLLVGRNFGHIADSSASGTVIADSCVGILVGQNHDIIIGASASGTVHGRTKVGGLVGTQHDVEAGRPIGVPWDTSKIINSSAVAVVHGVAAETGRHGHAIGGLVGSNGGLVQTSMARATITGHAAHSIGGLVGDHHWWGHIIASYAWGRIDATGILKGGLVGQNYSQHIRASYSTVRVDGGGLVGRAQPQSGVTDSYWDVNASGTTTSPSGQGLTTAAMMAPSGYTGIYANWNVDLDGDGRADNPWQFSTTASSYPVLRQFANSGDLVPRAGILLTADAIPAQETADDLMLTAIDLPSGVSIAPAFSSAVYAYTVTVPPTMEQVALYGRFASVAGHGTAWLAAAADLSAFDPTDRRTANEYLLSMLSGTTDTDWAHIVSLDNGESKTVEVGVYKWKADADSQQPFAEQAHKKVYRLKLTRAEHPTNDANLINLEVSPGSIAFSQGILSYSTDVASTINRVTVWAQTADPEATVTVAGGLPGKPVYLAPGANQIDVVVTAQDGTTTKTYQITVNRASDTMIRFTAVVDVTKDTTDDMQITGLALPPGFTIEPAFSPDHYEYTVTVPREWDRVEVKGRYTTPCCGPGGAWNGTAYIFASSSLEQSLENYQKRMNGDKSMVVVTKWADGNITGNFREMVDVLHGDFVYAVPFDLPHDEPTDIALILFKWKQGKGGKSPVKDNSVTKAYTLTMTPALPADTEAGLRRLGTSAGPVALVDGQTDYSLEVAHTVTTLTVTPTPLHPSAAVTVAGGSPDRPVALDHGANAVSVVVTAVDGTTTKTYTLTVTRSLPKPGTPVWQVDGTESGIVVRWRDASGGAAADAWDLEMVDSAGTKTTVCVCQSAKDNAVYNRGPEGQIHYIHRFTGLVEGQTYTVRIRGVNDAGAGEWMTTRVTLPLVAELEGLRLEAITKTSTGTAVQPAQSFAAQRTSYTISLPETVIGLRVLPDVTQPKTATINGKNSVVSANTYVSLPRGKTTNIKITVTEVVRTQTETCPLGSPDGRICQTVTEGVHTKTYTIAATVGGTANQVPAVASALSDIGGLEPGDARRVSLSGVFSDADGDSLRVVARSSAAAVATVSVASGYGSLTVRAVGEGTATVTVIASDGSGGTVSDSFTIAVGAANTPPAVASALSDISGLVPGDTRQVSLSGVFSDADGDSLTITARSSAAAVATVSVASGYGSLTVSAKAEGTATVTVTAADGSGGTVSDSFTVAVDAANTPPAVVSPIGDIGGLKPGGSRRVSLSGVFSDADGDSLSVTARSSAAAVATVSVASGYGSLTVSAVAQGAATVTVTAADGDGGTVSDTFAVTVDAPSTVPAVVSPISDISGLKPGESRTISLDGVFRSPSGFSLAVTATSSDSSVATLSVPSDYATMTVRAVAEGTASIRVTANDGRNTVSDTFTVTVEAADSGPGAGSESLEPDAGDEGAEAEEQDPVVRYDANGDGITQYSEYQTALADYLGGSLTIGDLMAVRAAWVRDAR